jgi:hypothetical protein
VPAVRQKHTDPCEHCIPSAGDSADKDNVEEEDHAEAKHTHHCLKMTQQYHIDNTAAFEKDSLHIISAV